MVRQENNGVYDLLLGGSASEYCVPFFCGGEGASVHRVENRIGTLHSILLASLWQV